MHRPSILFLAKKRDDPFTDEAMRFIAQHFPDGHIVQGKVGDPIPDEAARWEGDYLVSYLSPWIVPQKLLERARCAAINFHPGPPEYPGTGCYNFALYNDAPQYGVTCHHMARQVDTGAIIAVRRFPVFESDSVISLVKRSYAHLLTLFLDIASLILEGMPLPHTEEVWRKDVYTRAKMLELFRITPHMSADEVRRRVRAAEFPGHHGAYLDLNGQRFYHVASETEAPTLQRSGSRQTSGTTVNGHRTTTGNGSLATSATGS